MAADASAPATLPIEIAVVVETAWTGARICFPLVAPALSTIEPALGWGRRGDVGLGEFLEAWLPGQGARTLARFSAPPDVTLARVRVQLTRPELPKPVQLRAPVDLAAVIVTLGKDRWVTVPALDYTVHVRDDELLEDVVSDEVRRLVTAREVDGAAWLNLLPPRTTVLRRLTVDVERPRAVGAARKIAERERRRLALETLESVGAVVKVPGNLRVHGRDEAIAALGALLSGSRRLGVVLVGEPLVGKSAVLRGWLAREDRLVVATSGARLVAGMSGLGEWQERLQEVMAAAELLDAVLWFDDLGDLLGGRSRHAGDFSDAIKRWLEEQRVRVVGEIRPESLELYARRFPGLFDQLVRLRVEPLDGKATAALLRATGERLAADAVAPLVDLCERYLPYQAFPGKAVHLLHELRTVHEERARGRGDGDAPLDREAVLQGFAAQSGIPVFLLRQDEGLKARRVEDAIRRELVGQEEAVRRVVETVCVVKAGLQPTDKPLATFLFVGPTGTGKTQLARTLASFLFGSPDRMVRFDMSEMVDASAAARLIEGGDDGRAGLLTDAIRRQPFSLVLLDEIEKAHPAVFDLLLQVLGEGRLTDAAGRTAFFQNAIIILTSNVGATTGRRRSLGLTPDGGGSTDLDHYTRAAQRTFRPELLNRLDRIIPFAALTRDEVVRVADLAVGRAVARRGLAGRGIVTDASAAALEVVADGGYSETYGARAINRWCEDHVIAPTAALLARVGPVARGARLLVRRGDEPREADKGTGALVAHLEAGALRLELRRPPERRARVEARHGPARVSALRREAAELATAPPIVEVGERLELVVSDLATAGASRKGRRVAKDMARLQTEHAHLSRMRDPLLHELGELETIEELALGAAFGDEDPTSLVLEAETMIGRLRAAAFWCATASVQRRDAAVVVVQELDSGEALDRWLQPLLDHAHREGWRVALHLDRDDPRPPTWPPVDKRRWGPPLAPRDALPRLEARTGSFRAVLMTLGGRDAAVTLGAEQGVVRFKGGGQPMTHLRVRVVAFAPGVADDAWEREALQPATRRACEQACRYWTREVDHGADTVREGKDGQLLRLPWRQYWPRFGEVGLEVLRRRGVLGDGDLSALYPSGEGG